MIEAYEQGGDAVKDVSALSKTEAVLNSSAMQDADSSADEAKPAGPILTIVR